ncbi:CBS domain-containing protein CBSX5 [Acorus gramineus]|uniref:CBS domain-containing protein CBSX5 n=1 Tax=Acorus gramineus TaxID=55184 RepID=A0AAV9APP1_ACOGR|nr:CBS domain-containing protein CBSX5 [Acorus gramineus]
MLVHLSWKPSLKQPLAMPNGLLEALDLILEGVQNLVVPLRQFLSNRKKPIHGEFCWLTQEDVIRFLLDSIGSFSPPPPPPPPHPLRFLLTLIDLDILTVDYHDSTASVSALLPLALQNQTAIKRRGTIRY